MNRLDGKVALVTGGSSGIGFAIAQRFVEEGAYAFITGRRRPELDKAKEEIGENVTTVQGDVTVSADLDRLFQTIAKEKGKIDVVVANSGLVDPQEFGQITEESFDRTFNLNARGILFTAQKALPLMNDGGSIILVGSIAGHTGVGGYTTYSATKAAVRSYARTWTKELKGPGQDPAGRAAARGRLHHGGRRHGDGPRTVLRTRSTGTLDRRRLRPYGGWAAQGALGHHRERDIPRELGERPTDVR